MGDYEGRVLLHDGLSQRLCQNIELASICPATFRSTSDWYTLVIIMAKYYCFKISDIIFLTFVFENFISRQSHWIYACSLLWQVYSHCKTLPFPKKYILLEVAFVHVSRQTNQNQSRGRISFFLGDINSVSDILSQIRWNHHTHTKDNLLYSKSTDLNIVIVWIYNAPPQGWALLWGSRTFKKQVKARRSLKAYS